MDNIVDSIDIAYKEFVNEITNFLEAKQSTGEHKNVSRDKSALKSLACKLESFTKACDVGLEFVNFAKQNISCKFDVDNAVYEGNLEKFFVDEDIIALKDGNIIDDN